MSIDRRFINVIVLSFGFMLVFTAFQTMGNIEQTVLNSINADDPTFKANGYTSLAIIYGVFATCNWLAPSYISIAGPRSAILTGACCYALFIGSFLIPNVSLLYGVSALVGLGAAFMWTGHGQYLTENSDSETMSRNAGVFWAIFQSSLFVGNLFVYFMFTDSDINEWTRKVVFSVLTALAFVGILVLATLRRAPKRLTLGEAEGVSSADKELRIPEPLREKPLLAAWHALRDAFMLFLTPTMLALFVTFAYTGLALTFFSGVYSTSIGFYKAMGESRKSLVGLSGIFIGVGEVVGGAVFGMLASKVSGKCTGWPVVIIGFVMHLFAIISAYVNLPSDPPFEETESMGLIDPSPVLAMAGSLTLGFGDACYNTQVYSLLGLLFAKESAPAFALFKFTQSVAAAISFSYSSDLGLHVQLLILLVGMVFGTVAFCLVEHRVRQSIEDDRPEINPALTDTASIEE